MRKFSIGNTKKKTLHSEEEAERFSPALDSGLTEEQAAKRKEQGLFNVSDRKISRSYLNIVASNVFTVFNLIVALVAVALIWSGAGISQFAFVLMFLLNLTIGLIQEIRAKQKIDKLSILNAPSAEVIREGKSKKIDIQEIVLDDVIALKAGQQIPADCILRKGIVEVNESLLTGESLAVRKRLGETLYAGSFVVSGSCLAGVEKVGKNTYVNSLTSKAKKYKRPDSEIMNSTSIFMRVIAILMIPIAIGIFFINRSNADTLAEAVQATCAVIIGMIPAGMMFLTSAAMAVGILRMTKRNTLVQDMYSLEMLARVDVICLDKTGTITDGKMKVEEVKTLSKAPMPENWIIGNMLSALTDDNQTALALREKFNALHDLTPTAVLPFSSERKFSAVTFEEQGTFALGAPEFILDKIPDSVQSEIDAYTAKGLRVILLARSNGKIREETPPARFAPLALIALSDNIRSDAKDTISWFYENDVDVKVISGDNPVTVSEVARRAGVKHAEKYLSLENLTDKEVAAAATEYTVFGRVKPEQKAILVQALKAAKHKVAMTGDGVNDILAMKEADCAVAMAGGSEAARSVSNLVLLDNNFANMPHVVYEGRRVINNVKSSSTLYIMKTFFTAMLALVCIMLGKMYFFKTNNMLCFEALVAGLPSIMLSLQPNKSRLKGKYFTYVLCHSLPAAIVMLLSVMAVYISSLMQFGAFTPLYRALAVLAVTFSGLIMLFHICRPFNRLRLGVWVGSACACSLVFSVPFLANIIVSGWSSLFFSFHDVLILLCILVVDFPFSRIMMLVFEKVQNILEHDTAAAE
jgi:cation-transporting ATPase E